MYKAMTIAGSDTSGGAGMEADLKTFQELGVYGMTALTCIVAQNPNADWAHEIYPIETSVIEKQITTILQGIGCDAMKTGMLGSADLVDEVVGPCEKPELEIVDVFHFGVDNAFPAQRSLEDGRGPAGGVGQVQPDGRIGVIAVEKANDETQDGELVGIADHLRGGEVRGREIRRDGVLVVHADGVDDAGAVFGGELRHKAELVDQGGAAVAVVERIAVEERLELRILFEPREVMEEGAEAEEERFAG